MASNRFVSTRRVQTALRLLASIALVSIAATASLGIRAFAANEPPAINWLTQADPPVASATNVLPNQILRARLWEGPNNLDPASLFRNNNEVLAFNIYSGLVTYEGITGKIIPDIATDWSTPDNKTWTFNIRRGVKFHKGFGDLTADDVVYSYERVRDPATKSIYANELATVTAITAPDPYKVVITLSEPNANFIHKVAAYRQGWIVSKKAIEKLGKDYPLNPVGTGPFQFTEYIPGSSVTLTRFDDYYDGPAPLAQIKFTIIADEQTAAVALMNRETDLNCLQKDDERIAELAKAGFRMYYRQGMAVNVRIFNTELPQLSNPKVRQAWASAIDWATIWKTVSPLLLSPGANILPPWMDVTTSDAPRYPYDPAKARKLLAEAGYPNGFNVTHLEVTTVANSALALANQLEQSYLAAVGINLKFDAVGPAVFNQRRNAGTFDVTYRTIPAADPDAILFGYLAPDNIVPKGLNGARYNNPALFETMKKARATIDPAERKKLYAEVQRIAMTDLPYAPQYLYSFTWPAAPQVRGVALNVLGLADFHSIYMVKN